MLKSFRQHWKQFSEGEPGCRFQERYHRRQTECQGRWDAQRTRNVVCGSALVVVGLILVPAPGPGWAVTGIGGAMLGSEFLWIARFLDRAELRLRKWEARGKRAWAHVPVWGKALLLLTLLSVGAGSAFATYTLVIK